MTIATRHRRISGRSVLLLACAALVAGCAEWSPQGGGPDARPVEQVAVPEPAPATTQNTVAVASRKAPPKVTRSTSAVPARQDLDLSVIYYERIMIPKGSDLTIRADSANSTTPTIKRTTTDTGMPYKVSVPVGAERNAFPMTVTATLTSTIGHVMTGSVTLNERPEGPVELLIHTKQ